MADLSNIDPGDLRRLLDEQSILKTMHRYAAAVDYGGLDDYLDCFTEDGVYEIAGAFPPAPRRIEGRDRLREYFLSRPSPAPGGQSKHVYVNPRIEVSGATASAEGYYLGLHSAGGTPVLRSLGRYEDRLIRASDGRWRFRVRTYHGEASLRQPG